MGSTKESIAIAAITRRNYIHYMTTMAVTNAIISTGNTIAAAVSGGSASSSDAVKKTLEELRSILLPSGNEEKERKAAQVKALIEKEVAKGPIDIRVVGGKGKQGRSSFKR